ncbi:hypothetical protein NVV95_14235 [Herbiconiux sp. CPCC 205716]|uniref:WXG100 family type VII secretion target n=1 Tax=Herbiconiux gentiana TaxID=2970912 RepID=A0ABT2GHK1_9MICO|nr:hypothetical protein [Herbiconiux gentiana]MCS5715705.1 hypothetical protein [Herbiconiux gentiana]
MTGFVGADVAELRRLAKSVATSGERLAAIRSALTSDIGRASWGGPDGVEFTSTWNGQLAPALQKVGAGLAAAAESLLRNADEQDATSQEGAAGGGTGPVLSTMPAWVGGGQTPVFSTMPAWFDSGTNPFSPHGPGTDPVTTGDGQYTIGPPDRPTFQWDEDFEYDSESPNPGDYVSAAEWKAKLAGAGILKRDLDDGMDAYSHYWDNTGDPWEFDYEEAVREDPVIASNVQSEIERAQAAADELIGSGGDSFQFTGAASAGDGYPETENWQKAIGGYQQWSSGDVTVDGDQATMVVTVHAEDHYNFNRGQADIASNASDDENGRFTELGWAKPFDSSGSVTRTVTWTVGDPGSVQVSEPEEPSGR